MSTTSTTTTTTHHLQPTRQARRLHLSRLATTHHAALRHIPEAATRRRATAFTPMARDPLSVEGTHRQPPTHES